MFADQQHPHKLKSAEQMSESYQVSYLRILTMESSNLGDYDLKNTSLKASCMYLWKIEVKTAIHTLEVGIVHSIPKYKGK